MSINTILERFGVKPPEPVEVKDLSIDPAIIAPLIGEVLEPGVRTLGRAMVDDTAEIERVLLPCDLATLATERGSTAPTLKKIKDSHHRIARLMASGLRPGEVAMATGYSGSRLSILAADPAFQELLAFYREEFRDGAISAGIDLTERMTSFLTDAVQELHERLQDAPEKISETVLIEGIKVIADRAGYGPTSKQVNVNVDIAGRISEARRRAGLETPR